MANMGKDGSDEEGSVAPSAEDTQLEQRNRRQTETFTVNKYLFRQIQQMELMLLQSVDVFSLFEILLISLPRHFDLKSAELWLYDPEQELADIFSGSNRYGHHLQLHNDVFLMQELYEIEPDVVQLDATDSRMFEILKTEHGVDHCILLPLMESGRLIGSFHVGTRELSFNLGEAEEGMIAQLAAVISICLRNAVSRHQVNQLTMLDPLTHIGNPRGFESDISREISRAQRLVEPVSVLMMEIDEYDDLLEHYGEMRSHFVLKKVAERVSSDLRATDCMARFSGSKMAVLVPGSVEAMALEIAERMRIDIDDFAVDDGRGAILHVTLSVGLVTWEPSGSPGVDMSLLAVQMQTAAEKGLRRASSEGGNRVDVSNLAASIL
ncbi:MAG: GGDEF domain-containing protein [Halioglobus sp.]